MAATTLEQRQELAYRVNNGIEITLFWSKPGNRVTIEVRDARFDERFEFDIDGAHALDAFYHPYAYAASRSVHCSAATITALAA
jgi:hypothetical protein